MPTAQISEIDLTNDTIDIMTLLQKSGLVASKSEGRRAIEQGGVTVNGEKINDIKTTFTKNDFKNDDFVLKRGKKNFRKIIFK